MLYNPYVADTGRLTKRHREELPHVRGQGQKLRVPGCDGAGMAERSYPTSEVRGSGKKELPHIRGQGQWPRGAMPPLRSGEAAWRCNPTSKEQPHVRGATTHPKSSGCMGPRGPRGAIPRSRSGRGAAAVRRYPSPKVRSSSCALLEQP